jgi:hypothetical protein
MVGQLCLAPGYGRASCACGCRSWCHRLQLGSVRCPEALLLLAAPAVSHHCANSWKTVAAPAMSVRTWQVKSHQEARFKAKLLP